MAGGWRHREQRIGFEFAETFAGWDLRLLDVCLRLLRRDVGLFVGATDGIAVGRFEGWKLVRFVDLFVGVTDGL